MTRFLAGRLKSLPRYRITGRVTEATPSALFASMPGAGVGDILRIGPSAPEDGNLRVLAEVTGFRGALVSLAPLSHQYLPKPGDPVSHHELDSRSRVNRPAESYLGAVYDANGVRMDDAGPPLTLPTARIGAVAPLSRRPIERQVITGIGAIDVFIPIGEGQRLCILAEPGSGKSTLLGNIASSTDADCVVIALIGERGREVKDFLEDHLTPALRAKSAVIVSTSDEPAHARIGAARFAMSLAASLREAGRSVLLLVDSLTRLARALRETGLAAGEAPVRHGYPPSVFSFLPRFLEQAGCTATGAITMLCTVLTSSGFDEDPIADEVKSITDGHILLSTELAQRGHFPAIDILKSLSRLAPKLQSREMYEGATRLRRALAAINREKEVSVFGGSRNSAVLEFEEPIDAINRMRNEPLATLHQHTLALVSRLPC